MMDKYGEWIIDYERSVGNVINLCESATLEMQQAFPELIRKRGHVIIPLSNGRPEHWWLKTVDGIIVDPTETQFVFVIEYIEWDESRPEPTGKCPNCGEYCFDYNFVCSDKCAEEYKAYIEGVSYT